MSEVVKKSWHEHSGVVVASANGFDVIECEKCGFKHIISIPTDVELEQIYSHEYYTQDKPLYLERYREDLEWWNTVYTRRYEILEQHLSSQQRCILDIGSGPGYFLLNGKNRGWQVKGIEPSIKAALHSQGLDLNVENIYFSEETAPTLGSFDVINMGEVLEHIPNPTALIKLVHGQLNVDGLVCIIVPNDFNPFQLILRDHLGFDPWWVAPPHHINYFDFKSLASLLEKCGFEVLHHESTFPIDLFLLMGDNYVTDDTLGRQCHKKRKQFDMNLFQSGQDGLKQDLYSAFAKIGIGREIVMYARKIAI